MLKQCFNKKQNKDLKKNKFNKRYTNYIKILLFKLFINSMKNNYK